MDLWDCCLIPGLLWDPGITAAIPGSLHGWMEGAEHPGMQTAPGPVLGADQAPSHLVPRAAPGMRLGWDITAKDNLTCPVRALLPHGLYVPRPNS